MVNLNKHELLSPEYQEVMSSIPGSILKWGLFVFFALILILICGSYLIKTEDIVTVPFVMTTQSPPVTLVSKTGGEIERLFVKEGSEISKNEIVAIIRNTCDYKDVQRLDIILSHFSDKTDWIKIIEQNEIPPDLVLGEIQSYYSDFQKKWKQLKDYLDLKYLPSKLNLSEKQILKKTEYNNELIRQEKLLAEDLSISKNNYFRDSIFFYQHRYSISAKELELSRQAYLQKLYSFSVFIASLKINESDFLKMKETNLDLLAQYKNELKEYFITMDESLQLLRSSINLWYEKYVIKSPIEGKVTLNHYRNENQVIKTGDILLTIIPHSQGNILARAIIPISSFGNIEVGQKVNIKLSGFPYLQYGVLRGKIFSISQVPGEGGFTAEIDLLDGMTSTYREKIRFINEMDGQADIIVQERRLINELFNPFKVLLNNKISE